MRDMELIDKIIYLVFVLCGAFIMFAIPFGFYKFACIDFEILVYKKIVEATITIALLTAIPVVATLVYMFKYENDSRKVQKGQTFIAIKGLTVDGHNYIDDAINNGIENGEVAILKEE